jgi:UDP-2-acetamido-3-amino-2,3-dideoxy-glucuronate N-acetyltransferase
MIHETAFIHALAVTDGVKSIGARSKVWQFASVIRGAVLGEDCVVASGACFDGSVAGNRVIICHNLAAGPGFLLGDDVFIGPNVTLCNDAWPRVSKAGFDPAAFDGKRWAIVIEDGASVGAGATILPGVIIGKGAMVGAGVVCGKDVPAGHMMLSNQVCIPIGDEASKVRMRFAGERLRGVSASL